VLDRRAATDDPDEPDNEPAEQPGTAPGDLGARLRRLGDSHPSGPDYRARNHGDIHASGQAPGLADRRAESAPADSRSQNSGEHRETSQAEPGPRETGEHRETTRSESAAALADLRDGRDRPDVDAIHLPPEQARHILDGDGPDKRGGGHRHGTGRPRKTEFPEGWSDEVILSTVEQVAREPDTAKWKNGGCWLATGERDGVRVNVAVRPDGRVLTAWPEPGGRGVRQNP
jgi:hypothetical protein